VAVKSVIEIDLNDSAFKRFQSAWATWKKQADKPLAALSKDLSVLKSQTEIMRAQTDFLRAQRKLDQEKEESLGRQLSLWGQIATKTRDFNDRLRNVQTLLTRMGVGTAIAGVLGVGSLWGLDRLAGSVGAGRRGAQGLGISYGEQRAFRLNYERLVDAPGFLSSVGEAMRTAQGRVALYGAGLNEGDLQGKTTAQVASNLLPKLKQIADRTPEALLGNTISALHLDQLGIGIQDLVRLRSTSAGELAGIGRSYQRDVRSLGLADDTTRRWQDFYVQMERAGDTIENVFIKKLTPLIPGLTKLSDSVVHAIETFLGPSDKINSGLQKLGSGIEWLAGYVGSDDFQGKLKAFGSAVGDVATDIKAVWSFFHPGASGPAAVPHTGGIVPHDIFGFRNRGAAANATSAGDTFNDRFNAAFGSGGTAAAAAGTTAAVAGINADLASRLQQLRDAAQRDIGEAGRVTSGFRTFEDQARLYANRANNPNPVARPGFSQHERGLAADVAGSDRFMQYVHAHAAEYGLSFPRANDPVHVQLANPRVDIRIDNPAGANVFTTTNSVGQAP
jgi:D-alanyl-D-alanine carboxypeptidase